MSLFPHPPGSGNMHPQPRPLAPAIPSTPQPTSTNPHSILVPPKRTQVVAACEACRHRKAKCNAERPRCSRCIRMGLACHYRTGEAETPNQALKRKIDELQHKSDIWDELLGLLRLQSEMQSREMLRRLRVGDSAEDLVNSIREGSVLLGQSLTSDIDEMDTIRHTAPLASQAAQGHDPELREPTVTVQNTLSQSSLESPDLSTAPFVPYNYDPHGQLMEPPYGAARMEDIRLSHIKASQWTTVTADDQTVSQLLAIYFLYDHPTYQILNLDLFLNDMMAGRADFCSALLVNMILATACHGNDTFKNRHPMGSIPNFASQFLAEAERLLSLEIGSHKLTTIQALLILVGLYYGNGMDQVAEAYLEQAVMMAESLGLMTLTNSRSHEMLAAQSVTAWGLFCWQSVHSFRLSKQPLIKSPPRLSLSEAVFPPTLRGEAWLSYPDSPRPLPLYALLTFRANADLHVIVNDISKLSFALGQSISNPMSLQQIAPLYARLQYWFDNLPDLLKPTNIKFPCHLKLHIHYHGLLISLLQHLDSEHENYNVTFEFPLGPIEQIGLDGVPTSNIPRISFNPYKLVATSTACLQSLLRTYYLRHGFAGYDSFLLNLFTQKPNLSSSPAPGSPPPDYQWE